MEPVPPESGEGDPPLEDFDLDDLDFDDIDWDAKPPLRERVRDAIRSTWRRVLVFLGLRQPEPTPLEKLRNLILLLAVSKGADWVDITHAPGERCGLVEYGLDGERVKEMTPPAKLMEPMADLFEDWCDVEEEFAGATTYRGSIIMVVGGNRAYRYGITVRRPEGKPSSVFVEVYDAPILDEDEDDDDIDGCAAPGAA